MRAMRILEHSQLAPHTFRRSVVTVGNFDGVHRGHQALLRQVAHRARDLQATSVVYTFHPHPLKVLNPSFCPPLITGFDDRVARIAAEGIDALVWARFDREYAAQDPEVFVRDTLVERLGMAEVWVGPDFAFGRGRAGSIGMLERLGAELGFSVRVLGAFTYGGETVSSTRIRQAISRADFATAEKLLGRPYTLHGPVVHGAARGRSLGFPTANVLPREECLPPAGVYAAWATLEGAARPAAMNIGPNPTFGDGGTRVEAFLLDFNGDLYGTELELCPVATVRGEIAFRSAEDLSRQIRTDVEAVRQLLGTQERRYAEGRS
ncbi:MAG: bifunctional riboflavin kinase/FAD synthetase [Deferrisomatales bacterium]